MSSVEEIIAKIASDLRRQKIGQQALNASAKLNQIELLARKRSYWIPYMQIETALGVWSRRNYLTTYSRCSRPL